MKSSFIFILALIIPHLSYAQKGDMNYYDFVETTTLNKNKADILNAFNFIIKGRDVRNVDISLPHITNALKDDEVIIEFFNQPDSTVCSTYFAFVVKRGMKFPKLYEICKETQLISLIDENKDFYNNTDVLKLILHPVENELEGMGTIYYTPCGKLHEIALEYCQEANGKMLCENYNVFRMTSSSMICNKLTPNKYHHYSIWGGVDIHQELFECEVDTFLDVYDTRKLGYLRNSLKSAKQIAEDLKEINDLTVDFYHDETTTEINFKAMSGKDIDVLLIQTHGLFTKECSISPKSYQAPLNNHALALCGAASVIDGGIIPEGIEDGLITEDEIAQLDFSNMDLAVISACKSGLGTIEWDGVHGLMMGFKTAGVKSIIVTLDDVRDYVAGQLWIQLFRNLSNGQSKRKALLNGLRYIRTMDDAAFSHPKFWTPFILIDGL